MLISHRKRDDKGNKNQNDDGDKNDFFNFVRHKNLLTFVFLANNKINPNHCKIPLSLNTHST